MRERPHAGRQSETVRAMRPHVMRIGRSLIHAGHERRAARSADRRGRKDVRVSDAARRQAIDVGRPHALRPIAAEVELYVLGDDPQDVGALFRRYRAGANEDKNAVQDANRSVSYQRMPTLTETEEASFTCLLSPRRSLPQ